MMGQTPTPPPARRLRLLAAAALVVAGGIGATLFSSGEASPRPWQSPRALAGLLSTPLPAGTHVLIGSDHKPILGRDRKPLLVSRNGTILDSSGHPILAANHRPVKLGRGGTLSPSLVARLPSAAPTGSPSGHPRAAGRGPTSAAGQVVIGVPYQDAAAENQLYAQYQGNIQAADVGPEAQAVGDYINRHGGIGGRRLVLRLDHVNYYDNQSFDAHDQEVCDFFTAQGPRPVAVLEPPTQEPGSECLMSHGIVILSNGVGGETTNWEAQYANTYFEPQSLAMDRYAVPYVQGLAAQGFFGTGTRVGVIFESGNSQGDTTSAALQAELARAGIRPAATYTIGDLSSSAGVPGLVGDIGSAVLRFRAAGVNRVIAVDYGGVEMGLFMEAAQSQGYHPRYGISSEDEPNFLLNTPSITVPQLQGAVGVGWSPITDVAPAQDPGSPERSLCASIYQDAGVAIGGRTDAGQLPAYAVCDDMLMLRHVLAAGQSIRAGIESLGTSWGANIDLATRLSPAYHDGAGAYQLMAFDSGCNCFRYHGPLYGIG